MDNDIKVSVCCITYNHAEYIKDALESFVMQKTNFAYEILVHDDASTDGTADIVREYEKKYPNLIKPIYETENQYSKGVAVGEFNTNRAKGKYIAICEGDDYWTDPYKLQKQYDAMEAHPEVDMCAHSVMKVYANTKEPIGMIEPSTKKTVLPVEEVIIGGGACVGTSALFFRKKIIKDNTYEFRKVLNMDYSVQILGALRGGVWYLSQCMSAYRCGAKKSWTTLMIQNPVAHIRSWEKKKEMLAVLDYETNHKYFKAIQDACHKINWQILTLSGDYRTMLSAEYADMRAEYPRFYPLKLWIRAYLPWVIKIKERLQKV